MQRGSEQETVRRCCCCALLLLLLRPCCRMPCRRTCSPCCRLRGSGAGWRWASASGPDSSSDHSPAPVCLRAPWPFLLRCGTDRARLPGRLAGLPSSSSLRQAPHPQTQFDGALCLASAGSRRRPAGTGCSSGGLLGQPGGGRGQGRASLTLAPGPCRGTCGTLPQAPPGAGCPGPRRSGGRAPHSARGAGQCSRHTRCTATQSSSRWVVGTAASRCYICPAAGAGDLGCWCAGSAPYILAVTQARRAPQEAWLQQRTGSGRGKRALTGPLLRRPRLPRPPSASPCPSRLSAASACKSRCRPAAAAAALVTPEHQTSVHWQPRSSSSNGHGCCPMLADQRSRQE